MGIRQLYDENGQLDYKKIPLLAYLTDGEFEKMNSNFEILKFKKGDMVFQSGDPASKMFIIYSGFMKISKYLSDGREQILYIYQAGDFVGGLNILSGDQYAYNGQALKDTIIVTISNEDFHQVLLNNHDFTMSVLEKSYERIRRSEALIDRLSVINSDLKVAKLLINLIKPYGSKQGDKILLDMNITQEELGSFAGISRETMSRKLKHFEDMGYIELLARGKILITDIKALSELIV